MVSDRGQLVLVAALSVAVLIVGVTITLNSTLFVENSGSDESERAIGQAERIGAELAETVQMTAFKVNHRTRKHTWTELQDFTRENVTRATGSVSGMSLRSQSRSVNVSVTHMREGARVGQTADGNLTNPTGGPVVEDFWVTPDAATTSSDHRIGWYVLNLNASANRTGEFKTTIRGAGTDELNITIRRINDSAYRVNSTSYPIVASVDPPVTCLTRDGRLVLDLYNGVSLTDSSCDFQGAGDISAPSGVYIENGTNLAGKYTVVVNESASPGVTTGSDIPQCDSGVSPDDPCHTPAVWALQYETTVAGPDLVQRSEINVTLYPEGS